MGTSPVLCPNSREIVVNSRELSTADYNLEGPRCDEDVRQSIARIKASPFIPSKDKIRGFVYEVETGRLREVA
jgi:carbonic anhydrase